MAVLRRFYLVFDPDKNCCNYRFFRLVERVMEFFESKFAVEIDANAGFILVDAGVEIESDFLDGFDEVWELVEVQNFNRSHLVAKMRPGICDTCRHWPPY